MSSSGNGAEGAAEADRVPVMDLREIVEREYESGRGAGKPWHYWAVYQEFLEARRGDPLRLLELGVESGRSARIFREYLPNATIVGLDYHERPERLPESVHFVRGKQQDSAALEQAVVLGGPFDVVVDDAAHVGTMAKASHEFLYKDHVAPGGYYIFEDWGVALRKKGWADYHPYEPPIDDGDLLPSFSYGMVGLVKQQIDGLLLRGDPRAVTVRPGVVVTRKAPRR